MYNRKGNLGKVPGVACQGAEKVGEGRKMGGKEL